MRSRPLRRAILCGLYGLLSCAFCAPLFAQPNGLGVYDWDQHLFYYGSVLKNIVEYGQLPFWNPWYCGGNVLWQNPQMALFSPVYPLTALISLPLAMKINIVFHYWVGFVGMHLLLTRIIGLSFLPGIVYLASVFTLAGAPAMHLLVGHSNFLPVFYLPVQLFFTCRAIKTGAARDVALAAVPLALMMLNGGPHILPIALTGTGVFAVFAALSRWQWRPVIVVAAVGVAGFAYAAPKLLPVALFATSDHFMDARNPSARTELMTPEMLARAYLDPYQHRGLRVGPQKHGWFEYGNYIGSPAVLLTIASLVWILWNRRLAAGWLGVSLALTTVVLLALSAGKFSRMAPAVLVAHLPLFSNFNVPSRYTVAVPLFAAATIGWAAHALVADGAFAGRAKLFIAMICVAASMDLLIRNRSQFQGVFSQAPIDTRFKLLAGPKTVAFDAESKPYGGESPMFRALMANRLLYNCYEGVQLKRTADPAHPVIFSDDKSKISTTTFSPNRIEFSVVNGAASSRVLLNQNFGNGWTSTAGSVVPDPQSGKPSVLLAPGTAGRYEFRFVPPGLWLGARPSNA